MLSPILAHLWDTYWFSPILEQLRDTYSYAYTTYGRLYFLGLPPELVACTLYVGCAEAGWGHRRGGAFG